MDVALTGIHPQRQAGHSPLTLDEQLIGLAIPAFNEAQEKIKDWIAEPPVVEQLTPVGSYRLF